MNRIIMTISLLAASLHGFSQTGGAAAAAEPCTLDFCISYALHHSTAVEMQQVEARQARADYRYAKAAFLPSVEANANTQWSWGRGIDPETNVYNNVTTFNNYYSIYASLTIFDGGRTINAFRQARLLKRSLDAAIAKARDAKAIEVMQCYVDAVYARQSIALASQKLKDSQGLLAKTRRMMDLGSKSLPDVAQVEAQVASDDYNLTHQTNEAQRTLLALKAAMNCPTDTVLQLDTTIVAPQAMCLDCAEDIYSTFEQCSPEVITARAAAESSRLSWLQRRGALLPSLTLQGGISTNYYQNLSQKGAVPSFATQIKNNRGEYLGISLSVPIFNSGTHQSVRRARSEWQTAQLQLEDTRRKLHDNIVQAVMDRDAYAKEIVQMERKVQSDSLAHHLNTRKYEEGMLSVFELQTSGQNLLESRIKLLQMRMMWVIKQKLVGYYKTGKI